MEKQIITEIDRIKEIMKVTVISESVGPTRQILDNIFSSFWSSSDNTLKQIITNSLETQTQKGYDEISGFLDEIVNGTKTIDELETQFPTINFRGALDDLLSSTNGKQYLDEVYDIISSNNPELSQSLKNAKIESAIDFDDLKKTNPQLHDDIVDGLTTTRQTLDEFFEDDPDLAAIIREKTGLDNIPEKVTTTLSAKKFTKAVNKSIKDAVYEWAEVDLPSIGVWYSEMDRWYDTWSRDVKNALSAMRGQIAKLFGKTLPEEGWGTKSIVDKIEQLSNEITELMTKNIEEGTPEVNERMLARLTELIYSLKEASGTDPKSILDQLKKKDLISKEVYDELMKDNSKFMEWWETVRKAYESKSGKVSTSIGTGFRDEASALWEMNPLLFIFRGISRGVESKSLVEGLKGAWETATLTGKRWIWYLIWNDPRFPKEVLALRNARGTTALTMAGGVLVSHMVFTEFILPTIYALVYQTYLAADDLLSPENEVIYGPDEVPNFDWKKELLQTYKEHGGAFAADTESTMESFITQRLLFFTNIDNLMVQWVHLLKQDEVTENDVQEYKKDAEKTLQNIENEKIKLEQKLDSTLKATREQIESGEPVQDTIVDNANKLLNDSKEIVTNTIGETELTPEEAERIGFSLNYYLTELKKGDPNAKVYKGDDDKTVIISYNNKETKAVKRSDGWYYNNTDTKLYTESHINKKRMINQVNTKTLKESIRNKVLLKHEEKKYKIKKINENLRKFEENFYYGDYNKFFDKMFKLAESYKKSKLYLNEDDNVTFDSALIQSGLFKGQEDRMKQEFCNYVSNKLGLEGEVKRNFEDRVTNYPFNDIGQLFTDTDKMVDMIYKSFSDSISNNSSTPDNFISVLQSTIKPYLKTADFERNFKSNLTSVSEPIMDNARKKVDNLVMKIKELLAKEESKG